MSFIHPSRLANLNTYKHNIDSFAKTIKDSLVDYCNNVLQSNSELVAYCNSSNEVVIEFPTLNCEYVSERLFLFSPSGSIYQVMNFFRNGDHKFALQIYLNGKVDITVTNNFISDSREGLAPLPTTFDYNDNYLPAVIIENLISYHIVTP